MPPNNQSQSMHDLQQAANMARRALAALEKQAAGYTSLTIPAHLKIELEDKRKEVAELEKRIQLSGPEKPAGGASTSKSQPPDMQKDKHMSDSAKKLFSILIGIATIIACVAAVLVVPEVRQFLGLNSENFSYQVRVQKEGTGEIIKDAKVIIEVTGNAPLTGYSDSNGYARIFVAASYAGKPGRLRLEAAGYEPYWKEMDISQGVLPEIIYLIPLP